MDMSKYNENGDWYQKKTVVKPIFKVSKQKYDFLDI